MAMDLQRHWELFARERRAHLERRDAAFSTFDGHYRHVRALGFGWLAGGCRASRIGLQVLSDILAVPSPGASGSNVSECQKCATCDAI